MVEIGGFDQGRRRRRQARGQARAHLEKLAMGAGRPFDRPAAGLEQGQAAGRPAQWAAQPARKFKRAKSAWYFSARDKLS